jgi:hypothetical protein
MGRGFEKKSILSGCVLPEFLGSLVFLTDLPIAVGRSVLLLTLFLALARS